MQLSKKALGKIQTPSVSEAGEPKKGWKKTLDIIIRVIQVGIIVSVLSVVLFRTGTLKNSNTITYRLLSFYSGVDIDLVKDLYLDPQIPPENIVPLYLLRVAYPMASLARVDGDIITPNDTLFNEYLSDFYNDIEFDKMNDYRLNDISSHEINDLYIFSTKNKNVRMVF